MGTWVSSIAAIYWERLWSWLEPAEDGVVLKYVVYLLKQILLCFKIF